MLGVVATESTVRICGIHIQSESNLEIQRDVNQIDEMHPILVSVRFGIICWELYSGKWPFRWPPKYPLNVCLIQTAQIVHDDDFQEEALLALSLSMLMLNLPISAQNNIINQSQIIHFILASDGCGLGVAWLGGWRRLP